MATFFILGRENNDYMTMKKVFAHLFFVRHFLYEKDCSKLSTFFVAQDFLIVSNAKVTAWLPRVFIFIMFRTLWGLLNTKELDMKWISVDEMNLDEYIFTVSVLHEFNE